MYVKGISYYIDSQIGASGWKTGYSLRISITRGAVHNIVNEVTIIKLFLTSQLGFWHHVASLCFGHPSL